MNAEVLENTAGELTGEDAEVSEDPYAGMTPEEAEKAAAKAAAEGIAQINSCGRGEVKSLQEWHSEIKEK